MNDFYLRFLLLQRKFNKKLYQIADDLCLAHQTVYNWSEGISMPTDQNMQKLAAYFNVDYFWLKYGEVIPWQTNS